MAELHCQIQACDAILQTMEQMLNEFQGDLGNVSSEIQTLQDQSLSMSLKLKNRKLIQAPLGEFVSKMVSQSLLGRPPSKTTTTTIAAAATTTATYKHNNSHLRSSYRQSQQCCRHNSVATTPTI